MFGTAIRKWRRRHELTQAEIAFAAGATTQSVWNWEAGKYEPRVSTAISLDERWPGLLADLKRELKRNKARSASKRRAA